MSRVLGCYARMRGRWILDGGGSIFPREVRLAHTAKAKGAGGLGGVAAV